LILQETDLLASVQNRQTVRGKHRMDKQLQQRAGESAERMMRAGMTLSAGVLEELLAVAQRLEVENAAAADYIRFLEQELITAPEAVGPVLDHGQESVLARGGENPRLQDLRLNQMVLAGELNN
jgi:hypothetical protein